MSAATLVLAFAAGILSIFAPCVLPLLPIVLASAAGEHRLGPVALAGGIVTSFVVVGLTAASVGASIGLDAERLRLVGAVLFLLIGAFLLVPRLQAGLVTAAGPIVDWSQRRLGAGRWAGWQGQYGLGLVLGLIWTPCIGPTLATAMVLAAGGEDLAMSGLTMVAFGLGALLPLVALAFASRAVTARFRTRLAAFARRGRLVFGGLLIAMGILVLTGVDRRIEAFLLDLSPDWLVRVTTQI
ncbi:MAG: cytochrome c biogenesis CcdA family protein [Bauldia sp.]